MENNFAANHLDKTAYLNSLEAHEKFLEEYKEFAELHEEIEALVRLKTDNMQVLVKTMQEWDTFEILDFIEFNNSIEFHTILKVGTITHTSRLIPTEETYINLTNQLISSEKNFLEIVRDFETHTTENHASYIPKDYSISDKTLVQNFILKDTWNKIRKIQDQEKIYTTHLQITQSILTTNLETSKSLNGFILNKAITNSIAPINFQNELSKIDPQVQNLRVGVVQAVMGNAGYI